ncbi:MAG: LysR family transcriptional regulator [Solobacterium sp.]|nr:LysR family transcriptional regulator [Solobacterium sp.]
MLDTKLYTLLKVAEDRNFTHAAKALNLTQPAVSQHIHALEEELGTKLFVRTGSRLNLTREGEKAVAAAKAINALYNNLKYEISESLGGIRELTIGMTHTVESNRISEILAKYAADNGRILIRIVTGTQSRIRQKLKNYEVDLAIIDGSVNDDQLETIHLDTDSFVLILSPDHPLASRQSVSLEDIMPEKLILRLPESGTGNLFRTALKEIDMDISQFNTILELDNIATIKDLVRHGYGVSVLAKSACQDDIIKNRLTALPIDQLTMKREINIVCAKDYPHSFFLNDIVSLYHES